MAFKNIMIPEENRKEYEVNGEIIKPRYCTIDEDKKVMLFWCGEVFEEPRKQYFALVWREKVIRVLLKQEIENMNTTNWNLLAICIPKKLEIYREEIMEELRNAMKIYGFDGDTSYLRFKDEKYHDNTANTNINF